MKRVRSHALVFLLVGIVWLTSAHGILRTALEDNRLNWFPRQSSGNIVVVAIDSRSLEDIGTWPWPRSLHAELLDKLESAGVTDVAFDVDFGLSSNVRDDESFLASLRRAGGSVILPQFMQQQIGGVGDKPTLYINRPLPKFAEHAWTALVNVTPDQDGVVRRYPYGAATDGGITPSMGAMLAGSGKLQEGSFWIDYSILAASIPTVSYIDVLRGTRSVLDVLHGKKVIVGGTAVELGDRFTAPRGRIVTGPVLQVLAAESVLQGRDLQRVSGFLVVPCLLVLTLSVGALRGSGRRVILLVALGAGFEIGAAYLQANLPVIADTSLLQVAIVGYLLVFALEEIDFRGMLSRIAQTRFERVAMSLGDGLLCADHAGRITVCNPVAAAIFAYPADEIIGQSVETLLVSAAPQQPWSLQTSVQPEGRPTGSNIIELVGVRKDGTTFPVEASLSAWEGVTGLQYGLVLRDISLRKQEAERIRYLAEHDTLTGLSNRHVVHQHLTGQLVNAQTHGGNVALLLLDLDRFKEINDTFGHTYGDRVLVAVGTQLNDLVADSGLVARLGGDEFAVVVGVGDVIDQAQSLASKIVTALTNAPIVVENRRLWINASVGMAFYPDHGMTTDELFSNADLALYRAKANGRGQSLTFEREFRRDFEERLSLEAELKHAAENDQFELFYQPQIDLRNGKLIGAEALIRWRHPVRGFVSPAEFMPVINTSSMASDVGHWVLMAACQQGAKWQKDGHDIRIAMNLCPSQLRSGDLAGVVSEVLKETGFSPSLVELEVTEDIVLADEDTALENFRQLQELGVKLAFDDFGTGYAGMSYLKKFPFDVLKIDRSFVAGLRTSADDMAIVAGTISIGKQLGLSVIAEGIEDGETAEALRTLACEEGQGYFFGRPMPAAEFEDRFLRNTHRMELVLHQSSDAA